MISKHLKEVDPKFGRINEPYEAAEIVIAGIPLDLTSSYRTGSGLAPPKIREASVNLETYITPRLDIFESLHITDVGDLDLNGLDMATASKRIEELVGKIRNDGKIPVLFGGEHTLTYFSQKAFKDAYVVHFDAHRDLRQEYRGETVCHATVMRRILDETPPERLIQIGIRSCSKEEEEFARENGLLSFTAEEVSDDIDSTVSKVLKTIGSSPVYLSIDVDVLDPAFAPALATPEPGGLSTLELVKVLRGLKKLKIQTFDVVEFAAPYDNETTAFAAAKITQEVLANIAESRDH